MYAYNTLRGIWNVPFDIPHKMANYTLTMCMLFRGENDKLSD